MRKSIAFLGGLVASLSLLAAPVVAATSIAASMQLRGHLPELGERPSMRVFQTQAAYESFRSSLGEANVFPAPANMFMSFDRQILALYARGNDTGGRCLRTGPNATLDGDTTTLDLQWEAGTCGAPSNAHYPFILVALSRTAADGTSWLTPTRSVCASAPGVADSRACASFGTSTSSPSPATTAPSPTVAPTATAGASPTPTRTASPTMSPAATASATLSPTRSPVAVASPTSTASASAPAAAGGSDSNFLLTAGLIGLGVLVGIALMAARRPRRSIRRIP